MADKSEDTLTVADKIQQAKELFSRGSRNYLVKNYEEAADDLSTVSQIYAEVYGNYADELGMPYILYAKSLIALAQEGENKIIDVPEEEDEDDEEEPGNEGDGEQTESNVDNENAPNGNSEIEQIINGSGSVAEPQPGTSSAQPTEEVIDDDIDNEAATNLQIAWEVLEMAVKIFTRQGDPALPNLADAYFELAEISFENTHFEDAIVDYKKSLEIRLKLPQDDLRLIVEIHYKIGLSYLMVGVYEESIKAFTKSCEVLDCEIDSKKVIDPQTEKIISTIKELEEMKAEILIKITEVEETKQQSMDEVKQKLALLMSHTPTSSNDGAGPSTEEKSKPMDISHLIKRKKPDAPADTDDSSPAKRSAS